LSELGFPNLQIKFIKADRPVPPVSDASLAEPGIEAAPIPATTAPIVSPPAPARPAGQIATARSAAPPQPVRPAPVKFSKEDFKNDPLIQKALEIFKGTIVEVRA